jgi:hypothetical protein
MCDQCRRLESEIRHAEKFLVQYLDKVTTDRIGQLIAEKKTQLAALNCAAEN